MIPDSAWLSMPPARTRRDGTALQEYVARHAPDEVTEALDRVVEQVGDSDTEDPFVGRATRRVLETNEW